MITIKSISNTTLTKLLAPMVAGIEHESMLQRTAMFDRYANLPEIVMEFESVVEQINETLGLKDVTLHVLINDPNRCAFTEEEIAAMDVCDTCYLNINGMHVISTTDNFSIDDVAHELKHLEQAIAGRLQLSTDGENNYVTIWEGNTHSHLSPVTADIIDYMRQPWELEAYEFSLDFISDTRKRDQLAALILEAKQETNHEEEQRHSSSESDQTPSECAGADGHL